MGKNPINPLTGKPKRGRPKKIVPTDSNQLQCDFPGIMKAVERSDDAKGLLMAMLASRHQAAEQWRGLIAVPPTSLAEIIISEFRQKTNIPLEIPFFVLFSIISGFLLERGVYVETEEGNILPDIWTVILASSGAGKTYTQNKISSGLSETMKEIEFPGTGIVSSAAFVQALSRKPRGLWVRDEFAQQLKAMEQTNGPMAEMKDVMLQLYDNADISRETKNDTVVVENPALTILGLTVLETFKDYVTAESMLDGHAQRYGYVVAKQDPQRPWRNYPLWKVKNVEWKDSWEKIVQALQPTYRVDPIMMQKVFGASFQALYNEAIPESFYRRVMWKATKYALIYHVMRADASPELTSEDYGWAARALSLHIDDAAWLIGDHSLSSLERILARAEEVNQRCLETKGRPATARDLISGVKSISSAQQANAILSMIGGEQSTPKQSSALKPQTKIPGGRPEGI